MRDSFRRNALACALLFASASATASSHREAPFVTEHPKLDATDLYAFRSYEPGRESFVTILANYLPLQDAYGGPNYFTLDPEAIYEIHVDNDADAVEDLTFQFRFTNTYNNAVVDVGAGAQQRNVPVPLVLLGRVEGTTPDANDAIKNLVETYTVGVVRGPRRGSAATLATNAQGQTQFRKPLDYAGQKSFANYPAYADSHVFAINVPGCATAGRVFVGQRREGFRLPLGEIFDLININPVGPPAGNAALDDTADKNVTTLALELPVSCLLAAGASPSPIIGVWTTSSMRRSRILNPSPAGTSTVPGSAGLPAAVEGGAFVQVSRLGTPLVNEVVIGLGDKDRFNGSEPRADAQFATYVTHPTLPRLIEILFGVQPPAVPRADLVAAALTGVPGLNQPAGVVPSEMLRLNTSIQPVAAAQQQSLGVLAPTADTAGFPNGRRPGDDVVDILLRVMVGALVPGSPGQNLPVTDGVEVNAGLFRTTFPYLETPLPGSRL
jgi:hypothetical protein